MEPWASLTPMALAIKVVDIALVAYIVYRVLLTLRGTRTLAIAIGFVVVYLIYIFSGRLGLDTLSNVFDAFFSKLSIFVIFALIIFQDDIRRALTRMGTFRSRAPFIQTRAIEEVVQAAGALASKRIGGLVIFEGKADLDLFVTEGVELDSALTRETLFSIFIPSFENPLHDGAVLIRNYRIYKAAAIIRHLTARPDLPKDLGTRHRAAIGVTEETDAVAIVISEERGAISVCFRGNLVQSVSMTDLRSLLDARFRRYVGGGRSAWNLWGLLQRKPKAKAADREAGAEAEVQAQAPTQAEEGGPREEGARDSKGAEAGKDAKKQDDKKTAKEGKDASLDDPEVFAEFLGSK